MKKGTAITIGLLASAGIGGYLYYRYRKAKWLEELPGGFTMSPTPHEESLAIRYQIPVETVTKLIEAIPESTWGPPPEVVAEKILRQEFA